MKRRTFLAYTASALGAGLVGCRPSRPAPRVRRPPDIPFLDAHTHVNSPRVAELAEQIAKKRVIEPVGGAELVRRMDEAGIRKSLVLSTAYMMATDVLERGLSPDEERRQVEAENEFAAAECARFPNRLVPFLSVNPKREWAVDEIDRCVTRLGMKGLKLHLWNSLVDIRQPDQLTRVRQACARAAARGIPVVAHLFVGAVNQYGPADTERFVKEVIEPTPSLRISVAHLAGGGGYDPLTQRCFERMVTLCGTGTQLAGRVWTDMAATISRSTAEPARQRMGELVTRFGVERLLWGSDGTPNYLAESREAWPLGAEDWAAVCANQGVGLLGGGAAHERDTHDL